MVKFKYYNSGSTFNSDTLFNDDIAFVKDQNALYTHGDKYVFGGSDTLVVNSNTGITSVACNGNGGTSSVSSTSITLYNMDTAIFTTSTSATTISFSNASDGKQWHMIIRVPSTAPTITFSSNIKWMGEDAPEFSANAAIEIDILYLDGVYYGTYCKY